MAIELTNATGSVMKTVSFGSNIVLPAELNAVDQKLVTAVNSLETSSKVTVDTSVTTEGYLKSYTIKQGESTLATIDIPKDLLAVSGEIVYEKPGLTAEDPAVTGTFLKLNISTAQDAATVQTVYIDVAKLIEYNSVNGSTSYVSLTQDENHVISANVSVVDTAEGLTTDAEGKLATAKAVALKLATLEASTVASSAAIDSTAADNGVSVVSTVTQTAGKVAVETVKADKYGAAVAAETAAKAYTDAEIQKLDADLDASGTAAKGGTFVVSGITQVDGAITAVDSVEVESAGAAAAVEAKLIGSSTDAKEADTIWGAKAYADDKLNVAIGGANEALIGTEADTGTANTIWGAKNLAKSLVKAIGTSATTGALAITDLPDSVDDANDELVYNTLKQVVALLKSLAQ